MSLALFEGPAGSGKTTQLVAEVKRILAASPLIPGQRVLALTKMHGSRRRMDAKLDLEIRPAKADCQTIDGFALHLNRRWRDLAESTSSTRLPDELDFKGQSELAGQLLALDVVATWVARTYPIVVVDELQDSKDGQIRILEGLSRATRCVCAADEFQDLTGDAGSNASAWARGRCTPVILTGSHRTTVNGILDAADALRSSPPGSLVVAKGFRMSAVASAAQAGAYLSWEITSARSEGCTSAVVLTPTSKEKSAFVRDAVEWVRTKTATSSKGSSTSGPFKIEWESGAHSEVEELVALLKLTADAETQVNVRGLDVAARSVGAGDVAAGLQRRRTLTGSETIGSAEGYRLVDRALSMRRSFGVTRSSRLSAMTVHQAKNREFDAVVVLWPRKIRKDPEMQRRLLYNAITRARRRVLVLLEDSKRERIIAPPFVAP